VDTEGFLAYLRSRPGYREQIAHVEQMPARTARPSALKTALHPLLPLALELHGLTPLYSHQTQAIDALLAGRNVVLATGPASGKSLAYNAPVLDAYLKDHGARAIYLFPTKALAQDQLRALKDLTSSLPQRPVVATYDGDTPGHERAAVRKSADILLTNPEMLHLGILPNHRQWSAFLRRLRYVVVDEAHVYRGVFGSHVALLLRRLRRVCRLYGAEPQFVLTSATLGNPRAHAEALTGLRMEAVTEDGAPFGGRDFALWNPPLIDEAKSTRRSPMREGTEVFTQLVASGTRTLAFVRSRQTAELVYKYAREDLANQRSPLAGRISPYRAGYIAEERREIEKALTEGQLVGVVATTALELGIDIGDLDATVLNGYPGSLAATFQQAGRAGRRGERALSVLVASENPLEQYLVRHPDILFKRGVEYALVSTTNPRILGPHLLCAAYESPLSPSDAALFGGEAFDRATAALAAEGRLLERRRETTGIRWHVSPTEGYPAEHVHLRSTSGETFALVDRSSGRLLETIGREEALSNAHPGAVYLHRGEEFIVDDLDLAARTAYLSPARLPYYTQSLEDTDLRIAQPLASKREGATEVHLGEVEVTRTVVGYRRKRHDSSQVLSIDYLDLPPRDFPTVAVWWTVSQGVIEELKGRNLDVAGGLHACEHAAIGLLPLFALCDRWDIGGLSTPLHPDTSQATIFIYDGHPGGVGITERGYEIVRDLWQATLDLLRECPCEAGCPSCVQSPKCGNNNEPLDKEAARVILERLLGEGAPAAGMA
jgi:DEAD/DEAH box helicase domain-containing protein